MFHNPIPNRPCISPCATAARKLSRGCLLGLILLIACGTPQYAPQLDGVQYTQWQVVGGDPGVTHYSRLDQINRSNVNRLEVAWTFRTGDVMDDQNEYWGGSTIQANPIVVDGVLYATTPSLEVIALDAASGEQIWRFSPWEGRAEGGGYNRGVAYWAAGEDRRIYYAVKNELLCLNAKTGEWVTSFGDGGRQSMAEGLYPPHEARGGVISAGAPVIFEDLVIVGGMGEWRVPGNVSAYDARTGVRKWVFHNIPFPGETGYDTWGDSTYYREGFGANCWGGLSVDPANGMVFFATGQAKPDLHRPNNPGDHLFGNSVVALDARSGEYRWHFQELHHDLWDLDLPCAPMLIDLEVDGKWVPGLAQLSKTGNTFLFHRLTGEIYTQYEERPVPPSELIGEHASPTQPWVTWPEPFTRQVVKMEDHTQISDSAAAYAQARLAEVHLAWMTPPSLKGNIYYGIHGGAEWPGGAFDPEMQYLYINANQTPWFVRMRQVAEGHRGAQLYAELQCSNCHGWNRGGVGDMPALTEIHQRYGRVSDLVSVIQSSSALIPAHGAMQAAEVQEIAEFLMDSLPPASHPGASLYAQGKCIECHGAQREGMGVFPALTDLNEKYDDIEAVKDLIQKGKNTMPGFAGFSEEELTRLSQFLLDIEAEGAADQGPRYQTDRFERFLDQEGYPATRPPWGTMNAIDLRSGKIAWQVPLGEFEALTRRGIPPTGTENFGGPVVTAGGLVFIAATMDEKIRAFDKATGEILWEHALPAGGYTTPSTYEVDGKQYLVIPCGGGGKPATPSGDYFVAFALGG